MPRKKLIRRFEPRYTVSQDMVEAEAKYVAREFEDRMVRSTDELGQNLRTLRQVWAEADAVLEAAVAALPERERLALLGMIVRDVFHLTELYCTHLRATGASSASPPPPPKLPRPRSTIDERVETPPERRLPFSEWLFAPET
jgi:hypothetical protein